MSPVPDTIDRPDFFTPDRKHRRRPQGRRGSVRFGRDGRLYSCTRQGQTSGVSVSYETWVPWTRHRKRQTECLRKEKTGVDWAPTRLGRRPRKDDSVGRTGRTDLTVSSSSTEGTSDLDRTPTPPLPPL